MSKTPVTMYDDVLDEQTLQLLSEAPADLDVSRERMQRLRDRVMGRIDEDIAHALKSFVTVHNHDGVWIDIAPKIKKKVLFSDPQSGIESYLLKAEPGAVAPPHVHELDEHCLVLEGEIRYGDSIVLKAGDYQFAPAGSEHGVAHTDVGVLAYLQITLQSAPALF